MVSLKPNRRWFQIRLRTLLVAVAVCGVAMRVLAEPVFKAHRQAWAVDAIYAAGGSVYSCQGSPIFPAWLPHWTTWLCGCNQTYARTWISHVYFNDNVGDSQLEPVADCPNLYYLHFEDSHVTDAGLVHLLGLKQLKEIRADNTQITDAGLAELESLPNLKSLWVEGTRVTRSGIERFRKARPDCKIHSVGGSDDQ